MNNRKHLTREQALGKVLNAADIANVENRCLLVRYLNGLYEIVVRTSYLKYEAYVDGETGEVLGLITEPLPYPEMLSLCGCEEGDTAAAA